MLPNKILHFARFGLFFPLVFYSFLQIHTHIDIYIYVHIYVFLISNFAVLSVLTPNKVILKNEIKR